MKDPNDFMLVESEGEQIKRLTAELAAAHRAHLAELNGQAARIRALEADLAHVKRDLIVTSGESDAQADRIRALEAELADLQHATRGQTFQTPDQKDVRIRALEAELAVAKKALLIVQQTSIEHAGKQNAEVARLTEVAQRRYETIQRWEGDDENKDIRIRALEAEVQRCEDCECIPKTFLVDAQAAHAAELAIRQTAEAYAARNALRVIAVEAALQLIGNELSLHADKGPAGEAFRALLNPTLPETKGDAGG